MCYPNTFLKNVFAFQTTVFKGTSFYSCKHEDQVIEPASNYARNLCITDNTKAYLLNNFLKQYFFRNMAYVSFFIISYFFPFL